MSYENLASVYDVFMDNTDYEGWGSVLVGRLQQAGIPDGIVCELGCGTGQMTRYLARAGYDMIGVDASAEMLDEAQKKKPLRNCPEILYLQQDMREFELYGTVRAVVSVCDSMNYLLEEEELRQVFRLVNNYLDPGGLFLFDMNLPVCYERIGEQTIAENRPEGSFIWENSYDPDSRCNRYDLTLFLPEDAAGGLYRKLEETHLQRAYPVETIRRLLREAGMCCLSVEEAYTGTPVTQDTERVLVIAREQGKHLSENAFT